MTDKLADGASTMRAMIQIELPCCGAPTDLAPAAGSVRCEACAIEHLVADDPPTTRDEDRPAPVQTLAA